MFPTTRERIAAQPSPALEVIKGRRLSQTRRSSHSLRPVDPSRWSPPRAPFIELSSGWEPRPASSSRADTRSPRGDGEGLQEPLHTRGNSSGVPTFVRAGFRTRGSNSCRDWEASLASAAANETFLSVTFDTLSRSQQLFSEVNFAQTRPLPDSFIAVHLGGGWVFFLFIFLCLCERIVVLRGIKLIVGSPVSLCQSPNPGSLMTTVSANCLHLRTETRCRPTR